MKLRLCGLGRHFVTLRGRVEALRGIDLEIAQGEFFVLLGPSGCGKSTLLNLLAGLDRPSDGEIWFGERLAASARRNICLPPRERRVAMVFQSYALYPHLSVYGNIAFPLKIARRPKPEVERAVRRVARTLQLEDLLAARPAELSGGQRQRVAIARALVREPEVLLLDEPLSNLDARLRTSTRVELKRLQRELGLTTVYVTHDQTEAMGLGDRVAVLQRGRIEQVAAPQELYRRPANPFVAGFVGVPPMNLLEALWEERDGTLWLRIGPLEFALPETHRGALADLAERRGLAGIRPEHLSIPPEAGAPVLRGSIDTVEPQGREVLLHLRCAGQEIAVLAPAGDYRPGAQIACGLDMDRVVFFPAPADSHPDDGVRGRHGR